ncbi:hypothetical protein EYZ11_001179 [Aspergillus tanneri]|uniref:Uncharacterized protein n=1 Tax=Aspergillus tanneri TaxID=1220188 RepID=A0A4S3JVD9_9EURO|nr:uncharacterized protein ATNIH1004_002582 [Aspergillus tanneri]KAA8649903.1 hypothetical protein ATNIH1004_002582 [Aspergillus tanneri]THC99367.1 hypothetical protein EYZ11_001179 [Aspergillus tanneri]
MHFQYLFYICCCIAVCSAADPDLDSFPACALSCGETVNCSPSDTTCACSNRLFDGILGDCIVANCTIKEQFVTKRLRADECGFPEHRGRPAVEAATLVPLILASLVFVCRVVSKIIHLGGGWGWDDSTITVAYGIALAIFIINASMINYGFGKDMWDIVPFENITTVYKLFYAFVLCYKIQISLAKISVCLFLLRIFSSRLFRYVTYVVIALNVAIAVTWFTCDLLRCIPVYIAWAGWTGEESGQCIDFITVTLTNALVNIFVDVAMVAAPVYEITKLQLSKRKKVGVGLMFAMGLLLTIVAIIRVVVFWNNRWSNNQTAQLQPIVHWSVIEVQIAVLCACLPATRALINHFLPDLVGSSGRKSYATRNAPSNTYPEPKHGHIAKTMSYSIKYSSRAQRDDSSSVELVRIDR